jgi:hypothetical protein
MAQAVHILCALTSLVCAYLLLRGYRRSQVRLLLWSGLCFAATAIQMAMIFVDEFVIQNIDFFWVRSAAALGGLALLLYGLIWEAE